jgi:hypothetical protein
VVDSYFVFFYCCGATDRYHALMHTHVCVYIFSVKSVVVYVAGLFFFNCCGATDRRHALMHLYKYTYIVCRM